VALGLGAALGCSGCSGSEPNGDPRPDARSPGLDGGRPDADLGAPLAVEYLDPDHGPFAGGSRVLLRGRGFTADVVVRIGGRQVDPADIQFIDERRVLLRTPPGEPGPAEVAVSAGGLMASAADAFRYDAVYVDPPTGSIAGGTLVSVRGFGTAFSPGDVVTFDGAALTGVTVVSKTELTGVTPSGVPGSADVEVSGAGGVIDAPEAYQYISTSDPFGGGLGGGPIAGTLNVTVIDAFTDNGVAGAFVAVGNPATTPYRGFTDAFGHIAFAAPGLVGPVSVSVGKAEYERQAFIGFDRRDVTIFLVPQPKKTPPDGPLGPGRLGGRVRGEIAFGDATGVGVPRWDLVPEPRTPNEKKQTLVFTTVATPFAGAPSPGAGGIIDYKNDGAITWAFDINTRASALAVVAVAGLYDDDTEVFEPFAMGIARGLLVGPGETVENVSVIVDIPLDAGLRIELVDPPPLGTPRQPGPDRYEVETYVDLGGEGVIRLPKNLVVLPDGDEALTVGGLPPLVRGVGDATYTVLASATTAGALPASVRIVRGVDDLAVPLFIGGFLGVPRPDDPAPGQTASFMHLSWSSEGGAGNATFSYHRVIVPGFISIPEWRLYARGGRRDLPLVDLTTLGGVPPVPPGEEMRWTLYDIALPTGTFDDFTYRQVNINLWSAYAVTQAVVEFPPNP
jgi:hypothetical protein